MKTKSLNCCKVPFTKGPFRKFNVARKRTLVKKGVGGSGG